MGRFVPVTGAAMVFVNWWLVGETTLAVLLIAAGSVGFAKAKILPQRILTLGVRAVCVPVAGLGTILGLLLLLETVSGCKTVSAPIYSPSGRTAARLYYFDVGATGGGTYVRLFWARGFRQQKVFSAPWRAAGASEIRWISDSEMTIEYSGGAAAHDIYCASTSAVKIVCTQK